MNAGVLVASISINILSNFSSDLLKHMHGARSSPVDSAIANTVEFFPRIEGLKTTLEQWLRSPGVVSAIGEYSKGLKGVDSIRVDALSETLIQNTQFYLPDNAEAAANAIVARFLVEIREQYLGIPELAIPHVANRVEEAISISKAGFESLTSEVRELGRARDADETALDSQIDEARDHLQRNEYEVAQQMCMQLRSRSWDRMSARQKFRVLSNLATIHLRQEKLGEAARLFIEAKVLQPDDPVAAANEALAYSLLGQAERAFELAAHVKDSSPTTARAIMVWLETAPAEFTLSGLEAAIPPYLKNDAEVITALARRAVLAKNMAKAEELARAVTQIKADLSYPWALLGEAIFRGALPDSAEDYTRGDLVCDASRLTLAEQACTKAIELARKERQPGIEAGALLIRAEARRLRGDAEADEDIVSAYSINASDPSVIRDYAYLKLRRGQKRDAIEIVRRGVKADARPDLKMLLAVALSSTSDMNDRDEAIQIFFKFSC